LKRGDEMAFPAKGTRKLSEEALKRWARAGKVAGAEFDYEHMRISKSGNCCCGHGCALDTCDLVYFAFGFCGMTAEQRKGAEQRIGMELEWF
jgi:hypothetical protein